MATLFQIALGAGIALALIGLAIAGLSGLFILGMVGLIAAGGLLLIGLLFKLLLIPFLFLSPVLLILALPAVVLWKLVRKKRGPASTPKTTVIDI